MKLILLMLVLGISSISNAQQTPPHVEKVLEVAYLKAKTENKNVFVIFHASWCGWCHKMDTAMNDVTIKNFFDRNYIVIHITVEESVKNKHLENPGSLDFKKKHMGETAGLPFWLIFDANRRLIADSYKRKAGIASDKPGDNIGCPATAEEVETFIEILQKTSSLQKEELLLIANRFRKNDSAYRDQ